MSPEPLSRIGAASADRITVRGYDLAAEVMGAMSFSELTFLLISGRRPDGRELRLFDAVLGALADHGLTPSALAARLTHTGAPEAVQGAVAAGLLGAGSVFLGPVEDTARFLGEALAGLGDTPPEPELQRAAGQAVAAALDAGRRVPGLGHPLHKRVDPRTPRLYELARSLGLEGPHMRLLVHVARAFAARSGKELPVNGAGAAGAALADLGFAPQTARGIALVARCAGLVAHLAEESADPIGPRLWQAAGGPPS